MLTVPTIVLIGALHVAGPRQLSDHCLHHASTETPDQAARRMSALTTARVILSVEHEYRSASRGHYGTLEQLAASKAVEAVPPSVGFEVHLDVLDRAFWFEVVDTTDPCGFRYVSNQDGVIFTAEPIR